MRQVGLAPSEGVLCSGDTGQCCNLDIVQPQWNAKDTQQSHLGLVLVELCFFVRTLTKPPKSEGNKVKGPISNDLGNVNCRSHCEKDCYCDSGYYAGLILSEVVRGWCGHVKE